jgi:hypothetical protein
VLYDVAQYTMSTVQINSQNVGRIAERIVSNELEESSGDGGIERGRTE